MLYVDVNIGKSAIERITIFEGDKPREVAQNFARRVGISEKMCTKLEALLEEQMKGVLRSIREEEY